jgi:hypothetical protein
MLNYHLSQQLELVGRRIYIHYIYKPIHIFTAPFLLAFLSRTLHIIVFFYSVMRERELLGSFPLLILMDEKQGEELGRSGLLKNQIPIN